jgi:hypothetical protein
MTTPEHTMHLAITTDMTDEERACVRALARQIHANCSEFHVDVGRCALLSLLGYVMTVESTPALDAQYLVRVVKFLRELAAANRRSNGEGGSSYEHAYK